MKNEDNLTAQRGGRSTSAGLRFFWSAMFVSVFIYGPVVHEHKWWVVLVGIAATILLASLPYWDYEPEKGEDTGFFPAP